MTQILNTYATIVATAADWRVKEYSKAPAINGSVLVRELPNVDIMTADDLTALLKAETTFTNPQADGQTYTGTFANAKVRQYDNGDREAIIENEIIEVASPADHTALAALTSRKTRDNTILREFATDFGEDDGIAYIFDNINPTNEATFFAITDANLVTALPGSGWTYVTRKFVEQENNTATITVVFRKVAWTADAEVRRDRTMTPFETRTVLTARKEAARETEQAALDVKTIKTTTSVEDEFKLFDNTVEMRVAELDVASGTDATETAFETRTVEKITHDDDAITHTYTAGSIVQEVRNDLDEFGEYKTALVTRTAKGDVAVGTDTQVNAFEAVSTVKVAHDAAAETGSYTPGTRVEVTNNLDEFGAYTTTKKTITGTAVAQARLDYTDVADYAETVETARGALNALVDTTQVNGQLNEHSSVLDENGLWTTTDRQRVYNDLGIAAYESVRGPEWTTTRQIIHGASTAPTFAEGETYGTIRYTKNQVSGRYDGEKTVSTRRSTGGIVPTSQTGLILYGFQEEKFVGVRHSGDTAGKHDNTRWRYWKYEYDIRYWGSKSQAWAAIDDGKSGSYMSSGVSQVSSSLWESKKVVDIIMGKWNTGPVTEPTADQFT